MYLREITFEYNEPVSTYIKLGTKDVGDIP